MFHRKSPILLALCLTIGACSPSGSEPEVEDPQELAASDTDDGLSEGTLGPVHYRYDQSVLTRAEISLSLPPDFEQTVFAVKFIPAELVDNLGNSKCSYEREEGEEICTAEAEVGVALALLERPIETYGETIVANLDDTMSVESAKLAGEEGFALKAMRGGAEKLYTFVPVGERTLLLVERTQQASEEGMRAMREVRDSLHLPEDHPQPVSEP